MKRWQRGALWVAAFGLAIAGGVWYLIAENDLAWWLGGAATIPLGMLVFRRGIRVEEETGQGPGPGYGGMSDGPWGAP